MDLNDVLRDLDWDVSNIALPIANAENKILEDAVTSKTGERNRLQTDLEENRSKVSALADHVKNVRDELMVTQNLLGARKNELETETHLKMIAEREGGRLVQEIQRLKNDFSKMKERRNLHENEIFLANQQFDAMKSQMKWDQQALEAWLEESAQKDEDALTLQNYSKQDEGKIKELMLKMEKMVQHSQSQKKLVDEETLNTMTLQVELDKTAEEFRKTHKERQELIKQWEYIIEQMQKRDNDIDEAAQELMRMNMNISNTKDELEGKKKFYEDQANSNKDLNRNITILDQNIADFSLRLNRDENNRQHFQDELGGLKRTVERTGHDLEKSRIEVAQLKKSISEKRQLIEILKRGNVELVDNFKITVQSTMSAEENAKRMEELFVEARQHELSLVQTMKKRSEQQFKVAQELYEAKTTQKSLEAEMNGCDSTIKNLESRINQLDHESLKQAEVLYGQDFSIQSLERRISRLQGEKSNEEQIELAKKIAVLKERKEEKENQFDVLLAQFKRVEEDTRKTKRDIEDQNKDKTYLESKIAELTLHIDTAQRLLKKTISNKEDNMVDENLMKLEIKKLKQILENKADEVLDLNKRRIQLEMAMKERRGEINIHQDLLKTQLRSWEEEINTISAELQERVAKIEKLKKRYDIVMISMAPPEGTPPEENSQAYYVIKAAQEKEELQREGDTLNEKIKKAEKELRALENTLKVVNSKNDTIKKSYSKVGDESDLTLKKEELEEQLMAISDTYKKKRRHLKQLIEDVNNMEEAYNSMDKDENNYQELIADKKNKIIQLEKDIKDQREKLERATKQLITLVRDIRRAKNSQGPTIEEKDFKQKDLSNFNTKKARELVDVANQYPVLHQTLNILFAQANIALPASSQPNSQPPSQRSSRSNSRHSSVSNASAHSQNSQQPAVNKVKPVNIGFDLPKSDSGSAKSGSSSKRSNY